MVEQRHRFHGGLTCERIIAAAVNQRLHAPPALALAGVKVAHHDAVPVQVACDMLQYAPGPDMAH